MSGASEESLQEIHKEVLLLRSLQELLRNLLGVSPTASQEPPPIDSQEHLMNFPGASSGDSERVSQELLQELLRGLAGAPQQLLRSLPEIAFQEHRKNIIRNHFRSFSGTSQEPLQEHLRSHPNNFSGASHKGIPRTYRELLRSHFRRPSRNFK